MVGGRVDGQHQASLYGDSVKLGQVEGIESLEPVETGMILGSGKVFESESGWDYRRIRSLRDINNIKTLY